MSDHAALQRKIDALERRCAALEKSLFWLRQGLEFAAGECDGSQDCPHCAVREAIEAADG